MNKMLKVSFIIPTYNNEKTLERCLESITSQAYPDLEIIVVDGGSQDSTIQIASRYASKVIELSKNVVGNSRQVGVRNSSGEILAMIDSDTYLPSNDWLSQAVSKFHSYRAGTMWASNRAPQNASMFSRCYFNLWRVLVFDRMVRKREMRFGGGNSLFLRKAVEEAGGFNRQLHFGDDTDLANRIANLGYYVVFFDVPLIHDTMQSVRQFLKKQIWGASSLSVHGFNILGLNARSAFYEQVVLGFRGMVKGIVIDRDLSWSIFPLLIIIRSFVYVSSFLATTVKMAITTSPRIVIDKCSITR